MSCGYLTNEIDSMFENEHNDILLSDKLLWNNDNFYLPSNDVNWDSLMYDDINNHSYDQISDKSKDKIGLDFDYNIPDFELFEPIIAKNSVKLEPTHTNSVSSSYLTDDCSPTSSNNNSPVVRKVRKREFPAITDSSSEKSFALYEKETMRENQPASKSAKLRIMKKETICQNPPRTIYKVNRETKLEKTTREPLIIGNIGNNQRQFVKIRQASSTNAPYIMPGSIKSVNISKYSVKDTHFGDHLSPSAMQLLPAPTSSVSQNNYHSYSPAIAEQDNDLLTGEFYDHEVDLYSDFKPRVGSYLKQNIFVNSHQNTNTRTLFQTPIPQSGPLYLTEEEKRTLTQENYPIPTRVPLTKQEERNLKKVRRKIKNKLSAQESRRKKKEYVDSLEKKVEAYEQERIENKRRIETLENQQRTLQNQIRHYQHQIMNKVTGTGNTTSTGLMLFMICFALILVGGSIPSSFRKMNLPQSSLISGSSIYYMGYGPSRNHENKSQEFLMHEPHLRYKPDRHIDKTFEVNSVMPRQSILLGEEAEDLNFEELLLSYTKINKHICGRTNIADIAVISNIDLVRNNKSVRVFNSKDDGITNHRLANINFVK